VAQKLIFFSNRGGFMGRKLALVGIVLFATLAVARSAAADPIVDFSSLSVGGNITSLGASTTLGGVTATAWRFDGTNWVASTLIARTETNDNGLGVCSTGEFCNIGGTGAGDANELSELVSKEAIILERPADKTWDAIWLSSLDDNGTADFENGRVYWGSPGDPADPVSGTTVAALLLGPWAGYSYPQFGGTLVEGQIAAASITGFDPTARFLLFVAGTSSTTTGGNNDHLIWGVDLGDNILVPEPASFSLLAFGLGALVYRRRIKA
jgi:hypothetical protein